MNVAIAKAMLREQFQRTWPILAFCLGLCTFLCLIQYADNIHTEGQVYASDIEFQRLAIFLVSAIGFIALLYCHSDERNMTLTMPEYLYRLPVRTIDLVIWRMGYGLLCAAVIGVGSSAVCRLFFGAAGNAFEFFAPCRIGVMTFAVLQALAWTIGAKGIGRVIVTYVVVRLLMVSFGIDDSEFGKFLGFDVRLATAGDVYGTLAVSFLIAYAGVSMRRREGVGFGRVLGFGTVPTVFRDTTVERPPFGSPEEAMRWFEWRRQSRIMPWLVLIVTVFAIVTTLNYMQIGEQHAGNELAFFSQISVGVCCTTLVPTTVIFGAFCCFQNQRIQLGPQKIFFFVRPVTTKSIAIARMIVVLRSVVISMVPLLLVCCVAAILAVRSGDIDLPSRLPAFVASHMGLSGGGLALLLFCGMFAITWSVQWFGNLLAPLLVLGTFSALAVSIAGSDFGFVDEELLFAVTGLVLFAATAVAGYLAFHRDLLDKKTVYGALAIWPLLAIGFSALIHFDQFVYDGRMSFEPMLQHWSVVFALAAMPIAPLFTVPLFMHIARHR